MTTLSDATKAVQAVANDSTLTHDEQQVALAWLADFSLELKRARISDKQDELLRRAMGSV